VNNMDLHRRFLRDLAEIQRHPYPNIEFKSRDEVRKACLILRPLGQDPLHFTITFNADYPLNAPAVRIDTSILHPNIFGGYICASILNTAEGWTPAYTVKGIAIQLLSFFSSDNLEQVTGGVENLNSYRDENGRWRNTGHGFNCASCGYSNEGPGSILSTTYSLNLGSLLGDAMEGFDSAQASQQPEESQNVVNGAKDVDECTNIGDLPNETLVRICDHLESETLLVFARAWNRIGGASGLVTQFNLLRNREMQCFVLKKGFGETNLGVGVHVQSLGRQSRLSSEFDLLSMEAYDHHRIRKSVQGLRFEHFLPLAISRRHYQQNQDAVRDRLNILGVAVGLKNGKPVSDIIISFMNDIVVKLCDLAGDASSKSALGRASERAVESYYHLFHLLLCLATENDDIVRSINRKLAGALNGDTGKNIIPNLGHLLIGAIISDVPMTETLLKKIVKETITRNVVWMLDGGKGQDRMELAYLEKNPVSNYRLRQTFDASRTSYTLLMFQNTFRQIINRGSGANMKSIKQMREELFDAHGAPPIGTARRLSARVGQLQAISNFPDFLNVMGIQMPTASFFTGLLRGCIIDSVKKGYSIWGVSQRTAYAQRKILDPEVQERGNNEWPVETGKRPPPGPDFVTSFFPNTRNHGTGGSGGRGGRGGRGRGRSRGY
jgi:ubiquitin-protein ligase